jgi:ribosomal protein S18 acetylase RimI-like enzyme
METSSNQDGPQSQQSRPQDGLFIRRIAGSDEALVCAAAQGASEPWLTLRRNSSHALSLLNDPRKEAYVALLNGVVAGHCVLDMNGPFAGYIQVLFVMPAMQGSGVGAELLRFVEARIFSESPNVFLCVSGFNPRAQSFYERQGYERIGELKDYVVRGKSEFLMRKALCPKSEFVAAGEAETKS